MYERRRETTPTSMYISQVRSILGGVTGAHTIFDYARSIADLSIPNFGSHILGQGKGLSEDQIVSLAKVRADRLASSKLVTPTAACIGLSSAIEELTSYDRANPNTVRTGVSLVMKEWQYRGASYRVLETSSKEGVKRVGFVSAGDGELELWNHMDNTRTAQVLRTAEADKNQTVTSLGWRNGKVVDSVSAEFSTVLARRDLRATHLLSLPTVNVVDENSRALSYDDARKLGASDFFRVMQPSMNSALLLGFDWHLGRSSVLGMHILDAIGQREGRPTKKFSYDQFVQAFKEHVANNDHLRTLLEAYGVTFSFYHNTQNNTAAFMITRPLDKKDQGKSEFIIFGALFTNMDDVFAPGQFHFFHKTPGQLDDGAYASNAITRGDNLYRLAEEYIRRVSAASVNSGKPSHVSDALGQYLSILEF